MPRYDFDMLTIGAGSAASQLAPRRQLRRAGRDRRGAQGRRHLRPARCVPKKLLVYGSQFADAFADAAGFGWTVAPPKFDWPSLIAAKDKELDRLEQI